MTHKRDVAGHSSEHTADGAAGSLRPRVGVFALGDQCVVKAEEIARRLGIQSHGFESPGPALCDLALLVDGRGLSLLPLVGERELTQGNPVKVDWSGIDTSSAAGRSLDQPLLKAVGLKNRQTPPVVVDGTAGLGEDSYVMASLGARVHMLERQPILALMLEDHLMRMSARQSPLAQRMSVMNTNASDWLTKENIQCTGADVVYLDFMFPVGRKSAERKQMKVLRMLAGADDDAVDVLGKALACGVSRVVVKRPLHAEPVTGPQATHQILGKSLRFDVYLVGAHKK